MHFYGFENIFQNKLLLETNIFTNSYLESNILMNYKTIKLFTIYKIMYTYFDLSEGDDKVLVKSSKSVNCVDNLSTWLSKLNSFVKPFNFVEVPFSKDKLFEIVLKKNKKKNSINLLSLFEWLNNKQFR